jgi:signal transduction histidine kinase
MSDDGRPLLLNVDDYDATRYTRTQHLERAGFTVREASTGAEALSIAAAERPQLVLLDVNLPDMSGFEVCRRLKREPRTAGTPILHVSATYTQDSYKITGLEGGADAYLTEPVEPPVLIATIHALLRMRRAEAARDALLVRERAARAEAEAANRAKDDFLATVSHELRAPLSAILGWTRMLRTSRLDPPAAARALETIERNVHQQTQLINDLLDVSRIVSGKISLEIQPVDIVAVVRACVESMRPTAVAKGVLVEAEVSGAATIIPGDGGRLQQVVGNLLSNAVKFTPTGGRVQVTVDAAGDEIRLVVADTGCGITPDFLPHVFDRFRQAETSAARSQGGLGLGLAIVRHLVELHGGRVAAASEGTGRGATFTVVLPARRTSESVVPELVGPADGAAVRGARLLLVEDKADARDVLALALEAYGATVWAVGSTRAALATIAAQGVPDAVISDIALPDEDGYALIRRIRALGGRAAGVPAIALTAWARPDDMQAILAAGYQAHIPKPADIDVILQRLGALLTKTPVAGG